MGEQPIAFGVVGAGAIAQSYGLAFNGSETARVTGVADLRAEAASAFAERFACPSFADHQRMLDACDLQALLVCSPPDTHREICIGALERGIPALCEKPLALDEGSARSMLEAAEKGGAILSMASKFRYVDDIVKAKSLITSGAIGDVILFENTFCARVDMASRWNSAPAISGGGVLIDNGTHSVDVIRYFFGPIAEVHAIAGKNIQKLDVEDTVRLFVRTESGVMGSVDLSWSLNKEKATYVDIFGSDGTIQVGWQESRFRRSGSSEWQMFGSGYDKVAAFKNQLDNFCAAVRGEDALLVGPEDALASVHVITKAYDSLKHDHWIGVETESPAVGSFVHPTAIVELGVEIGEGTKIWDHVHVRGPSRIGSECLVGGKSYIAYGVDIGDRVKINAQVYICTAVTIEDGVMISAGTIFTNDRFPRATAPDLSALRGSEPDETTLPTRVRQGATIGAGAVIGCDLEIGRFAMVGMGSVVTRSVPDFQLVVGNPAKPIGFVCRCGQPFHRFLAGEPSDPERHFCAGCATHYEVRDGAVVDLPRPAS